MVVESRPGDVIAFDLHTFHASFGGRDRLAWTIEYLSAPEDEESPDENAPMVHRFFRTEFSRFRPGALPGVARLARRRGGKAGPGNHGRTATGEWGAGPTGRRAGLVTAPLGAAGTGAPAMAADGVPCHGHISGPHPNVNT